MQTIQAIATVNHNGELTLRIPRGIPPGRHQVVLVIDEKLVQVPDRPLADLPVIDIEPWSEDTSLPRDDSSDDDDR